MNRKISVVIITGCLLITMGCQKKITVSDLPEKTKIETRLEQSARKIQEQLSLLAELKQMDFENKNPSEVNFYKTPDAGPLSTTLPMAWNGPLEMGIKVIADSIGYTFEISGLEPVQPIIVTVNSHKMSAFEIIETMGWQAGRNVEVGVNEREKLIKILYLNKGAH